MTFNQKLNAARGRYTASIHPTKPTPALLGAFINGAFQIVVATNPALAYVRYLNGTQTTAKHRNRVDLTTTDQATPIALYYDEYDELAIWGPDPTQAGAVLQAKPTAGAGAVKSVTGSGVDNSDPVNPVIQGIGALYIETVGVLITNDATEESLYSSGTGSRLLPANWWTVGKTVELLIGGLLLTDTPTPGNGTWNVGFTGLAIVSSGALALVANLNTPWFLRAWLSCLNVGVGGTILGGLELIIRDAIVPLLIASATQAVDTTAPMTLDVTYQFDTTSAANSLTSYDWPNFIHQI